MHRSLVRKIVGVAGSAGLLAALPAAVPLAGAEPGDPPAADERRVLTTEHVDAVNVGFDGERLTVDSKIGPPVEHVAVDELVFQLSDLALVEGLPQQYAEFLGTDSAWVIQQTQNPDVLWAGWSTEELTAGVVDGDAVDITLTDVRGPGAVEVWQTVGFGEVKRIFSSDEDHTTLRQGIGAHVHANWAFTQPGVYTVTFTVEATVGGQPVTSGPVDYTWVVGGESGTLPAAAPSTTSVQVPPAATVGEEVVLEAGVITDGGAGAPAPGGHVQFHDGETALGWAPLTDGRAALPVTFAEPGEHTVTATYTSQEPQFYAPSTSAPAIVTVEEGDVDPPATTLTVAGPGGAVPAGEPVTLTVSQDPPTGLTAYQWSTRAPGALTFETVEGATTDTLAVTPSAADDGRQYRAALSTDDGVHVTFSAPYTLAVEDDDPPQQCEDPRVVLDHQHVDLVSPRLTGGELTLEAKVGSANDHVFYAPDDVLVQVKDPQAAVAVPDDEEYAFLGEPGAPLWLIPQTQNPEIVWAGWSTEDLALGAFRGDVVHITLRGVEGPGELEVFSYDEAGTVGRIFSSTTALDPRRQAVPMHSHANWAFTALGEYTVTFEVSGTLADGTEVTTGPVDYAFVVGDVECDPGEPGDESGGDESGGDESGGDESGGDESGGDESGGDESGGDASGGDVSGGDESGADGGTTTPTPDPTTTSTTKPTTKPTTKVCVPRPSSTGTGGSSAPSDPGGGTSGDPVVLTTEHVDLLAPFFESGRLGLRAKVGSAADHTYYDPADVLVNVVPAAASTVPSGDNYAFLGTAGAPLWLIPETQNPEVVWAGWSTEDLAAGAFAGDAVDMRLVSAEGPGTVEVFQTTGFGDIARIFSSEESLPARQQSVGQHVHANWAFSAEGSYTLTFEVSGTAGGEAVTTGPVEYSFVVGELSGARNASAPGSGVAAPAVYRTQPTVTQVDSTPTPTPTPTATPSTTPSPTPSPTAADCDLASTGTSSTPALTVLGGLLVAGGAVAMAAYWRDRRAARA